MLDAALLIYFSLILCEFKLLTGIDKLIRK